MFKHWDPKITYGQHKQFFKVFFSPEDFKTKTAQFLLKEAQISGVGIRTATFYQIYREIRSELEDK